MPVPAVDTSAIAFEGYFREYVDRRGWSRWELYVRWENEKRWSLLGDTGVRPDREARLRMLYKLLLISEVPPPSF